MAGEVERKVQQGMLQEPGVEEGWVLSHTMGEAERGEPKYWV